MKFSKIAASLEGLSKVHQGHSTVWLWLPWLISHDVFLSYDFEAVKTSDSGTLVVQSISEVKIT